jgi:hypothetical protein
LLVVTYPVMYMTYLGLKACTLAKAVDNHRSQRRARVMKSEAMSRKPIKLIIFTEIVK